MPDLVVIDQFNQAHQSQVKSGLDPVNSRMNAATAVSAQATANGRITNLEPNGQPEAASLINNPEAALQPQQITFECLVSFDRRKDKNLIVKWHHDDRAEPIYQWIPELNKRSIAPQYRAFIAPIVSASSNQTQQSYDNTQTVPHNISTNSTQTQTLEAGFRLVRPSKELGGKLLVETLASNNAPMNSDLWKSLCPLLAPRRANLATLDGRKGVII